MLSCVMKRSQTLGYSKRGSSRVVGGVDLCESAHTIPLSVWTARPAMVRYLLTYPATTPFTTRYAPGLQRPEGWGVRGVGVVWASAYFQLGLLREEGLSADLVVKSYLSSSGKQKTHCFQKMNISHLRLVQRITWRAHACSLITSSNDETCAG